MNRLVKIFILAFSFFFFLGCDQEESPEKIRISKFNQHVRSLSHFQQEEETSGPIRVDEGTMNTPCDGKCASFTAQEQTIGATGNISSVTREYMCNAQQYKLAAGHSELFLFDMSEVIYPGSIFKGSSIVTGEYKPILSSRNPMSLSVSIVGVTEQASARVEDPSRVSNVRDATIALLRASNTEGISPPANYNFTVQQLDSSVRNQFGLFLGVNIKSQIDAATADRLGLEFGFEDNGSNQSYVGRYVHRYYTVDIDLPQEPSSFFKELPELNENISPVYISSVAYGRTILFNMKSNKDEALLQTALHAAQNISDEEQDGSAEVSSLYEEAILNTRINATVVGGNSERCGILTNIEEINNCLREGGLKYQDGVPIAYTLRFLNDNTVARVVLNTMYNARTCRLENEKSVGRLQAIRIRSSNNDGRAPGDSDRNYEVFGFLRMNVVSDNIEPGDYGRCNSDFYRGSSIIEVNGNHRIDSNVGGSFKSISSGNYIAAYQISSGRQNIELCGRFWDYDPGFGKRNDELMTRKLVISAVEIRNNGSKILHFSRASEGAPNNGRDWVDIELKYIP